MAISSRGEAARQLLASLPEFASGDKPVSQLSDAYANRLAGAARRQLESGLTPSRQAARGHILTPEHPRSAPPKLPEQPATYRRVARTSKEAGLTGETPPAPAQRRTAALTGEPSRPLIHRRPPFQAIVPFPQGGVIYTVRTEDEARRQIDFARIEGEVSGKGQWGDRIVINVLDCTKGKYFQVFQHAKGGYGISAGVLLEMAAEHGGLESLLMSIINDDGSVHQGKISHICLYEIVVLPGELPAVKQMKQRLGIR